MTGYTLQVATNVCGVKGHNITRLYAAVDEHGNTLAQTTDLCNVCGMLLSEIRREKEIPEGNNAPSS